jgi:hypothetical protein
MIFNNIRKALEYTVENLVSKRHTYIINVRGPREIHYEQENCFQVVAQTMPYRDCEAGLTLTLPFDQSNGVTNELLCFLEWPLRYFFDRYVWSGIPCFALKLGKNIDVAERVMMLLLIDVYDYTMGTEFECEVSDEGAIDASEEDEEDEEELKEEEEAPDLSDEEPGESAFGESKTGETAEAERGRLVNRDGESDGKDRLENQQERPTDEGES